MTVDVYVKLFLYFASLSFLTIGGGVSILGDMHRQTVEEYQWFTDDEFLRMFALSRLTPGPGTIIVVMLGWKLAGPLGAVVAALGIFLPSSLLVYGLARLWARNSGSLWQRAIEIGLAPVAAGMIIVSALTLMQAATGGVIAWGVAMVSGVLLMNNRIPPLIVLGLGGGAFGLIDVIGGVSV